MASQTMFGIFLLCLGLVKPELTNEILQDDNTLSKVISSTFSPNRSYEWKYSNWSSCTGVCGMGGYETRNVSCVVSNKDGSDYSEVGVDDSLCQLSLRLPLQRSCDMISCQASWHVSEWSRCFPWSGLVRKRSVSCQLIPGINSEAGKGEEGLGGGVGMLNGFVAQSPSLCVASEKPEDLQPCKGSGFVWFSGPWSECNSSCGVGNQSREVWCTEVGNSTNVLIVPERLCAAVEKPASHQRCYLGTCFGADWVVSSWSRCSNLCEQRFETRLVMCVGKDGRRHPDVKCDSSRQPVGKRLCNRIRCESKKRAKWFSSDWSTCSVSCGHGRQFRSVICAVEEDAEEEEGQLRRLSENDCLHQEKMEEERECQMSDCQAVWITSSFGKCSSSCGEGQRKRFIWCLLNQQRLVDKSLCNASSAPSELEDCNIQPCPDDIYRAGSCLELEFGCCADGITPADGPDHAGCPLDDAIPFGFCLQSEFGCCPDQMTPAQGPFAEGCFPVSCQDTEFGCCPDGEMASPDAEQRGCQLRNSCESLQYGCCPDGITPANGPDHKTGCLPSSGNSSFPCTDGDGLSCISDHKTLSCHESPFGCCHDGITVATLGACNTSLENFTIAKSSNHSTDSNGDSNDNSSSVTAFWILRFSDSDSSYQVNGNYVMMSTTTDQESASGEMKDDDNVKSDLTVSQYDDKNLSTSDFSHVASTPTVSGLNLGEQGRLTPPSIYSVSEQVGPCSTAPYGCCPDGITMATGPENAGCLLETATHRQKPGLCALPISIGDCQEKHRVWFYNATLDQCSLFHYSGCGGNTNRFVDEYQCNAACKSNYGVPRSLATCVLPADHGPCNVPVTKWHYNHELGQCQPFTFGGCEGNDNKFDTRRECEGVCSVIDICHLPVDTGNCSSNSSVRFYFSPSARDCLAFTYSGCNGNANNFRLFRDCSIVCKQTYNLQVDLCLLPSDPGPCRWFTEWFYFSATLGICQKFSWGGCGGNRNRFATMEKCLESCTSGNKLHGRLPAHRQPGQSDVCLLKNDPGPCKAYQPMWYFEPMEKACRRFLYGGCGGNANLFETWEQCARHCQTNDSTTDSQPTTSATGLNEALATVSTGSLLTADLSGSCLLPRDPGPCIAYQLRWYFDQLEARCQQFHYGGCQGNSNNYNSSAACEAACHEFVIHVVPGKQSDMCTARRDPGPCFADFLRYHWDQELKECRPFIYGGCQGNSNNFVSQDDCYLACASNSSQPSLPVDELRMKRRRLYKPGDCYESLAVGTSCTQSVRWYFDMISGDCLPFYYRGCIADGNNFHSHEDCISFCLKVVELCGIFQCDLECEYGLSRGPDGCLQCQCSDPCESYACGSGLECHLDNRSCSEQPCQMKPVCKSPSKSGVCPIFADNWSEIHGCKFECKRDVDCPGTDKCCLTGCGKICVPLLPKEAPTIADDQPSVIVTTAGDNIMLPCKARGAPLPQVTWFKNGNPIVAGGLLGSDGGSGDFDKVSRLTAASDWSLVIRNVSLNDAVPYTCRALNTIGSATRTYTVIVQIPARILDIVPRNQTVREGESVRFECLTEGQPVPVVLWHRNNETLNQTDDDERLKINGSILKIDKVLPEFQGTYECVASNSVGDVQRQSVNLDVLGIYYVNITTDSSKNLTVGTRLYLVCNVSGAVSQDMMISWSKDGKTISSESKFNRFTDELIIEKLKVTDSGKYSCKVTRGEEEVEDFVHIQVREAPAKVPPGCIDKPWLADCKLLVQARLCHHPYYGVFCCRSCYLARKFPK